MIKFTSYEVVICLVSINSTPATANTLSRRDVEMVSSLGKQARRIEEDIQNYKAGRALAPKDTEYIMQSTCWDQLFRVTEAVTIALSHNAMTVGLSSQMINSDDEAHALMAAKADTEGAIAIMASARKVVGYVLGACSSDTLLVAESQQMTSFLDQADTVISSLTRRLPSF